MQIEVDPRFQGTGKAVRKRRRNRLIRRLGGGVAVAGLLGLIGFFALRNGDGAERAAIDDGETLVQSEETAESEIVLADAAAEVFLDLRGAPMIINLPDTAQLAQRRLILDQPIHPERAPGGAEIQVFDDTLLDGVERVQLTLPSSSADLAAFQARRATALDVPMGGPVVDEDDLIGVVDEGEEITVAESDGSWGTFVGDAGAATQVSYVETVIENTTTEVLSVKSTVRKPLFQDTILRGAADTDLTTLLSEAGVQQAEIDRITSFLTREAPNIGQDPEALLSVAEGGLVALRKQHGEPEAVLMQMSIYSADRYLLTIAQPRPGRFETAADPWFSDNLLNKANTLRAETASQSDVRLKDAIYSAALRHGVPSELVGELLVMLSRVQDLDRITGQEDRLRVLFTSDDTGTAPAGRILFAALRGPELDFKCYVLRPEEDGAPYGCFDPNRRGPGAEGGSGLGAGYLVPVSGTKTSGFGPRHHPILKRTVNHNGVDWAAPTGTPIKATAAGRIAVAGVGGGYGNVVYIDHPGGVQSRYAHLHEFAAGLRVGQEVASGEVIGYVGTTGRSTGPHLHFELHVNGQPVDPLSMGAARASGAVEALVNQIIRVESAGNATAKNPLSTATGLGQFIESTWLRMMRTYRPDLVARLSRQELLNLRVDPALSRAMVTNLARENEAFLRARGHHITAGRLYLAHFLGPGGANTALRSDPNATVLSVMGAGVVNANPFLRGRTVGWMTDWSDRKMRPVGRGAGTRVAEAAPPPQAMPVPAEVKRFKEAVDAVVAAL